MDKNKVKFGLENVHYAKEEIALDGTLNYGTPVAIPGAVNLTLEAEGEETPFYADNQKYFNSFANNGYTGDLEVADIPEDFKIDILGERKDKNGALIEVADAITSPFALLFQVEGDKKGRRFVYYHTSVSRPSIEAKTIESSKEPMTDKLSITTSARSSDKKVKAVLEPNDSNKAVYENFFKTVYEEVKEEV